MLLCNSNCLGKEETRTNEEDEVESKGRHERSKNIGVN